MTRLKQEKACLCTHVFAAYTLSKDVFCSKNRICALLKSILIDASSYVNSLCFYIQFGEINVLAKTGQLEFHHKSLKVVSRAITYSLLGFCYYSYWIVYVGPVYSFCQFTPQIKLVIHKKTSKQISVY